MGKDKKKKDLSSRVLIFRLYDGNRQAGSLSFKIVKFNIQ